MKKSTHNRLIALLLVLFMLVSMIPVTVQATEADPPTTETTTPAESEPPPEPEPQPEPEPEPQPEPQPEPEPEPEPQPEPEPEPQPEPEEVQEEQTARQDAAMAGGTPDNTYGHVVLNFNESREIKLYSGNYITACEPDANVWSGVPNAESDYLVWYLEGILFLNGNLQDVRIDLRNAKRFPNESQRSVLVYVKDNVTMSGHDTLLDLQDGTNATLHIDPDKRLTLNYTRNAQSTTKGAAIDGGGGSNLTVIGGGELHINAYGSGDKNGSYTYTFGIALRGDLTLSSGIYSAGSPDVQINVSNDSTNTASDKVFGVDVHGLTVKDESFLKIDVTGRALDPNTEGDSYREGAIWGRVNGAINAGSMKLLDKASVDITSHKNVVSDIALTGGGEVLMVNTEGYFHITNYGNITRYTDDLDHKVHDHPDANIYLPAKEATANIVRVEKGMVIDSYSRIVDRWYDDVINGEDQWNWVIGRGFQGSSSIGKEPTLGTHMYVGTRRIGKTVEISASDHRYTWGKYEYIYSPDGVATVKQSSGLTMDWEKPEGAASSVHYARVIEPGFNDIYVVHKGADLSLEAPEGKGTFLYWYDALHPEGSGNGTSWTNITQRFTNIQQDMVLVPVRDPMTNGPTLSDVGYKEQWDNDLGTNIRYAYQDLTFEKEDNISNSSGYRVMLVPAQLPRYGENTYAVEDLKGSPVMGLSNSRLYADAKPSGAYGTTLAWENIPEESYRIAYDDDETGRCFFSKPFTFDPPVAPPYISPGSGISEDNNHVPETVTITVERNKHIEYRVWNSSTNKWTSLQRYTGPIDVNVSVSNDVRIEAYAGSSLYGIKSEAYYAVRPTGTPTVKYGETNVGDGNRRYFYDSIDLTVEAPEGYEVYYRVSQQPYESSSDGIVGTKVENGKVTITDSGNGSIYFKLAKAFTVDGVQYRKLSHNYASVHLSKLTELPAPKVTVKTKEGGTTLTPSGPNTYTIKEFVNVELTKPSGWPLNATMAYDTSGGTSPQNAVPYTVPFEVRGEKTISVFTRVPKAGGGYDYERENYVFKVDPSVKKVLLVVRNATAYDSNGNVLPNTSTSGVNVPIGARIKVVPTVPSGKIFKNWSCGQNIYDTPNDKFKEELFFTIPDTNQMLILNAEFAEESEAYITGDTKVLLVMGQTQYNGNDVFMQGTVGDSVDLFINQSAGIDYHALRTISYQWWEGESVGTVDNARPTWATFDENKTYTVKVTITANEGVTFASTAGVQFGTYGSFLKMKDVTRSSDGKTLTFVATPLREMKLTLPTLYEGDSLSKVQESFNTQLSPMGYAVDAFTWGSGTPATAGPAGTTYYINTLKLKLNQNRPLRDSKVIIDGTYCIYSTDSDGKLVVLNNSTQISLKVKPKGVSVSGTVTSYGDTSENVTVTLTKQGETTPAFTDTVTGNSVDYSFETVPAGDYTLKVEKKGHAPWTESITVDSAAIAKDVTVYLYGDVNKDGKVNGTDALWVRQSGAGSRTLDAYQKVLADLNRDGKVNGTDVLWIRQIGAGSRTLTY